MSNDTPDADEPDGRGGAFTFHGKTVYAVYEHRHERPDRLAVVFEPEVKMLTAFMHYVAELEEGDGTILRGEFHAAYPGDDYLADGDWYLTKSHGVSMSEGVLNHE